MASAAIDESDEISRCIIFDRFFQNHVHVDSLLWLFGQSEADGASHESGVLRRLAPDKEHVHSIGCQIAERQNERRGNPPAGPSRRYYCGFRTASVASLPRLGDGYRIEYSLLPEDGIDAHVDVALFVTATGKSARATRRTDAGLALAEHFGPPLPHRCNCDEADEFHPFSIWGTECLFEGLNIQSPAHLLSIATGQDVS